MLVMSEQFTIIHYTKVPSSREQIWQLTILENNDELQIIADFIVII